MDIEIREKCCVSVISRLNNENRLAAEIVRAVKAENKVRLMFVQGKRQQTIYARGIQRLKANKQVKADLFWF